MQTVVDDVGEKRITEGVYVLRPFVIYKGWGSDGKWVECQGTREGEDVLTYFWMPVQGRCLRERMGILMLLSTWNRRSELI